MSARSAAARRSGSAKPAGSGTRPVTGTTISGFVPQVTCGASSATSIVNSLSYVASGSDASVRQSSSACSHAAPVGAAGRPSRYANVVSSGAIIPARAPASIDMLQIVIRFSIDRPRIASPVYSSTCPIPPATPSRPIAPRIMSFAVTLAGSSPSKRTRIERGRVWGRHCVASTCSTSDVPTPNASAPNAPCVAVWLSPQTIVIPGCVSPSSGPITWTIPSRPLPVAKSRTPNSCAVARARRPAAPWRADR